MQARVEIGLLQLLNSRYDPGDRHHVVRGTGFGDWRELCPMPPCVVACGLPDADQAWAQRAVAVPGSTPTISATKQCMRSAPLVQVRMVDFFLYRSHLCLVFEKLDVNLFELLRRNGFRRGLQGIGTGGLAAPSSVRVARPECMPLQQRSIGRVCCLADGLSQGPARLPLRGGSHGPFRCIMASWLTAGACRCRWCSSSCASCSMRWCCCGTRA
jgi:hypothetical protein